MGLFDERIRFVYPHAQHNPSKTELAQVAAANSRVRVDYGDEVESPCELLPETAFRTDDEIRVDRPALRATYGVSGDEIGPNSATVRGRLFSCTAGWPHPPESADLYEALRAESPTPRQSSVIRAWLQEATLVEIMLAWIEEVYSWRVLVRAIHRLGHRDPRLNRYVNQFADPARVTAG